MTATLPPGALPLANDRQEAFAVARARGLSLRLAAIEAGYTGGESNASRRGQLKAVAERIDYLKGELARVERDPSETFDVAKAHQFRARDCNLEYLLTEWRMQLSLCRAKGDEAGAIKCLTMMTAAMDFVRLQAPGVIPKTGKGAKRALAGEKAPDDGEQQRRTARAPTPTTAEEVSEVLSLVDELGGGLGDEPEEEGAARD